MRLFWLALFFLFLLRIFFFLDQMNIPALPDEMGYAQCVKQIIVDSHTNLLQPCSAAVVPLFNFYPAFILSSLHFYHIPILTALRLVTFLISCAVIYVCALILRERFSPQATIASLLALGTNPALMQFSIFSWVTMNLVFLHFLHL